MDRIRSYQSGFVFAYNDVGLRCNNIDMSVQEKSTLFTHCLKFDTVQVHLDISLYEGPFIPPSVV